MSMANLSSMFYVIAKYNSKFGSILYCARLTDQDVDSKVDFNNVYIYTLYFKGSGDVNVGSVYELQTIKGENGLTYCFIV
ncbi:MAG: hypothetical protein IJY47_01690 [Clostridia bacterium]|nr:hypothetical protein [Clostridia bacterium]